MGACCDGTCKEVNTRTITLEPPELLEELCHLRYQAVPMTLPLLNVSVGEC